MTKLTAENLETWTRAKTMEVVKFAETQLGVVDLTSRLVLKISTKRRARSSGGIKMIHGRWHPWTSLHVAHFAQPLHTGKPQTFREYPSISKHPIIGDKPDATAEENITILIVHELAHVIDYYTNPRYGFDRDQSKKIDGKLNMSYSWADGRHRATGGHGARWQALYALLRIKFVNNGVTDPKFTVKKQKARKTRKSPQRRIETQRVSDNVVRYLHNGKIIAVGRTVKEYWGNHFQIYTATPTGRLIDCVKTLDDGRGARRWVLENLI